MVRCLERDLAMQPFSSFFPTWTTTQSAQPLQTFPILEEKRLNFSHRSTCLTVKLCWSIFPLITYFQVWESYLLINVLLIMKSVLKSMCILRVVLWLLHDRVTYFQIYLEINAFPSPPSIPYTFTHVQSLIYRLNTVFIDNYILQSYVPHPLFHSSFLQLSSPSGIHIPTTTSSFLDLLVSRIKGLSSCQRRWEGLVACNALNSKLMHCTAINVAVNYSWLLHRTSIILWWLPTFIAHHIMPGNNLHSGSSNVIHSDSVNGWIADLECERILVTSWNISSVAILFERDLSNGCVIY